MQTSGRSPRLRIVREFEFDFVSVGRVVLAAALVYFELSTRDSDEHIYQISLHLSCVKFCIVEGFFPTKIDVSLLRFLPKHA